MYLDEVCIEDVHRQAMIYGESSLVIRPGRAPLASVPDFVPPRTAGLAAFLAAFAPGRRAASELRIGLWMNEQLLRNGRIPLDEGPIERLFGVPVTVDESLPDDGWRVMNAGGGIIHQGRLSDPSWRPDPGTPGDPEWQARQWPPARLGAPRLNG